MHLTLQRFGYTPMGTFGTLLLHDRIIYTLERPWHNNAPRFSCIPEGQYDCLPRRYFRGGYDSHEVLNVPGRTHILIHKGNTLHDTEGCLLLGTRLGCLGGLWAVLGSGRAFREFQDVLGGQPFTLKVLGPSPAEDAPSPLPSPLP